MGLSGLCRGLDAFDGELEVVDGGVSVARCVFDGAAGEANRGCEADGFGAGFRGWAEAVLQVGRDGEVGGLDDLFRFPPGIAKNDVPRESPGILAPDPRAKVGDVGRWLRSGSTS